MEHFVFFLAAVLTLISSVTALECYICENQDSNKDKCIKTTKQCEEYQDICMSVIGWGIPPYWTPRGDRIYKITKDCSTKTQCQENIRNAVNTCKRDWYLDWRCVECCSGDLCNFYVTLAAPHLKPSVMVTVFVLVATWFTRLVPFML